MKRTFLPILLCALASCSTLFGNEDEALFPPLDLAWEGVYEDIERGLQDGIADGDLSPEGLSDALATASELEDAIEDEESDGLRDLWLDLKPWAERGIADRVEDDEIVEGAAASLLERVRLFNESVNALPLD